ncbi:unnamed protein product [marine sediment metagenome]|uniref:Uncharacterized protein n=1 Tax=marine sediment metagenome TaxID=412755 RepID=X1EJ67_9ZZZZ
MAKVIKCLDTNCVTYIFLDDNRVIHQPKETCDKKQLSDNITDQIEEYTRTVKETVYVSKGAFKKDKIVEGEELKF